MEVEVEVVDGVVDLGRGRGRLMLGLLAHPGERWLLMIHLLKRMCFEITNGEMKTMGSERGVVIEIQMCLRARRDRRTDRRPE